MSGGTGSSPRKRPPELSLSEARYRLDGSDTIQSARQRRELGASSSSAQSPDVRRSTSTSSLSRNNRRKKEQAVPLSTRLYNRIEIAATTSNIALEKQLRRHGRYISRNPIRTLLLACLIITSLFYPAAGIYLWASKGGPGVTRGDARSVWRSLSTPLLDSFASSGRKHHNSLRDLRMIWDDAPDLRAVDARDADAYLGSITPLNLFPHSWPSEQSDDESEKCRSVRVEHVFVTTDDVMMALGPRYGALDIPILQSVLSLQETIESMLKGDQEGLRCVRGLQSSECLTLSPLSFWDMDAQTLASDNSPTITLLGSKLNITSQGIPLSLTTTLAGRSHLFTKLPRADHLALTFFLEDEEDCRSQSSNQVDERLSKGHQAWLSMLRNITGEQVGILSSEINATKEVVLQFVPVYSSNTFITQRFLLASGYVAVFIWLTKSFMKIQNVHSRFGLAFTGVVELIISMIAAISICALCGIRLTLIPWEILPFVVVVIGSENMFVLTNAIISTPISLTVSSRVATGLEKVGVPIAVTVMSDVVLMTLIMMLVDVRAVREFCIFAIFSLFVDFFLQLTLYSTVLSIDLQRFELADLLSQGGPLDANTPVAQNFADDESIISEPSGGVDGQEGVSARSRPYRHGQAHGGGYYIKMSCRAMWRARTARTASLSLLLAFMFGIYLYHGSGYPSHHYYPLAQNTTTTSSTILPASSTLTDQETPRFNPFSHLARNDTIETLPLPWWHKSPSASFWQALNPEDAASVRMKVEPWTVISLRSTKTFEGTQRSLAHFAGWAIFRPRVRAIIWFFKLAVLPICGTTGLLWILLLYLLKDTELLEVQQNKSDAFGIDNEDEVKEQPELEEGWMDLDVTLRVGKTSHTSDVEMVRQSGGSVVSFATDSSLSVWKPSKRGRSTTIVLSAIIKDYSRVTSMEVDSTCDMIALGHASGHLSLWTLSSLQAIEVKKGKQSNDQVTESQYPVSRVQSVTILPSLTGTHIIISAHRDGSIWKWTRGNHNLPCVLLNPQLDALWMSFPPSDSHGTCRNTLAMSSSGNCFQLYRLQNEAPYLTGLLDARDANSVVRCAAMSTLNFGEEGHSRGSTWSSVVVGTSRGSIAVYNLNNGQKLGQYDLLDGPVTMIRLAAYSTACPSLSHVGNRDVLLVNSRSKSTVMALSTVSNTSPVLSASKSPQLTPFRNRNGSVLGLENIPVNVLAPTSPTKTSLQPNGHINDVANGTLLETTPMAPLAIPPTNGTRHRRFSSQGRRSIGLNETSSPQAGDASLPTASTIGSAQSSVLDHFDIDPFDSHGTSHIQWARLASLECVRGGADLVLGSDGATLFGVRKRTKPNSLSQTLGLDGRWEAFQLDIPILFSSPLPQHAIETTHTNTCRLEIEESLAVENASMELSSNEASKSATRSVHFVPSARSHPSPLSFTHLDQVQAFYKERQEGKSRTKKTIVFLFANSVGAVSLHSS